MNADISVTIKDRELGFQIPFRSTASLLCHAHKPPRPVAPTIFMLGKHFN